MLNTTLLLEVHQQVEQTNSPVPIIIGFVFAVLLSLINIYIGKLDIIDKLIPKFRLISLGAGVSVSYIFLETLPELGHAQIELEHSNLAFLKFLENHIYLLSLIGLLIFYGLENMATQSRQDNFKSIGEDKTSNHIFWIHLGSFAIYNILIGELLSNAEKQGLLSSILFCIALGLHFLITDYGLRDHHKKIYDHIGRWILGGSIIFGWIIGIALNLPEIISAMVLGLVAGGLILNVLKEELPQIKKTCFLSFTMGTLSYAVLLLAI